MAMQPHFPTNNDHTNRPSADFPPSIWGYSFASFSFPKTEFESYDRQVEELKENVMDMLMASRRDPVQNIEFINLLCRLGLSYHFETEIEEQVSSVFKTLPNLLENNDHNLYTVSLLFRVSRQHGYKAPCDVFKKFKDDNGEFKKTITNDVEGILNLYEAAFYSVHGENILDEALAFARTNLEYLTTQSSPRLAEHIKNALIRPFFKGVPRVEARKYISFYEEEEFRNETLLKMAKLDFNRVMLLHQEELATLSRWWEDLKFAEELPYARDRIAEAYFWINGHLSEPQYALARIFGTKYIAMISAIDDMYDAYATLEELQLFTDAIERCNSSAIDQLPTKYMKVLYKAILSLLIETECVATKQGRSYCIHYVKEELKDIVRDYLKEAQWANDSHVPPFNEYLDNGYNTSTYGIVAAAFFVGMEEVAGIKAYEWLNSRAKIIKASMSSGRLVNDIVSRKFEAKRNVHSATGVDCYMNEFGISENEAIEELWKLDENAWKDVNEDSMKPTAISTVLLKYFANIMRATDLFYVTGDDGYTNSSCMKDHIISLFVKKIPI